MKILSKEWIDYFVEIADVVRTKSKDKHTKVGAIIVGEDNEIVSTGYNSFPRGLNDNLSERFERPEKYYWMSHAEENAIVNAARIGVSTKNCKMFIVGGFPCTSCARKIINAGIKEIYVPSPSKDELKNKQKWDEETSRSLQMFKENLLNLISIFLGLITMRVILQILEI